MILKKTAQAITVARTTGQGENLEPNWARAGTSLLKNLVFSSTSFNTPSDFYVKKLKSTIEKATKATKATNSYQSYQILNKGILCWNEHEGDSFYYIFGKSVSLRTELQLITVTSQQSCPTTLYSASITLDRTEFEKIRLVSGKWFSGGGISQLVVLSI